MQISMTGASPAIARLTGETLPLPNPDRPGDIRDAAQQFEGVLIAQMLKSVHDGGSSWMGSGEDSNDSAVQMAEECFAKALSAQGGLGLARVVESALRRPPDDRDHKVTE